MIKRKQKIDRVTIERANNRAKNHVQVMRDRLANFDRYRQGIEGNCKYCSYVAVDRIGGAAITSQECALCDKVMTFGSTCTDILCKSCAKENMLCRHCGGDVELKNRRNDRAFQRDAKSQKETD